MKLIARLISAARGIRTSLAAAVSALLICTVVTGCTAAQQKQVKDVVAQIGQEIPKALPLVNSAASVAEVLLPADALLITGVTAAVNAGLVQLAALCNTYANAPSDSVWASIQALVSQLVNTGAAGLLDAAKITDPDTRLKATALLGALQTALLLIDGYVQQAQTKQQIQASAKARTFRLQQVKPYLDQEEVARETGAPFTLVYAYEVQQGF